MKVGLKNIIGILAAVLLFLGIVVLVKQMIIPTSFGQSLFSALGAWKIQGAINVALAGVVGGLGALAFYFGVNVGFIGPRKQRDETLLFLKSWKNILGFILIGGVVAIVFQAAQSDNFAPIQAFVLGATWPSVVTRVMSGGEPGPVMSARELTETPAAKIPNADPTKTAADAQIVI